MKVRYCHRAMANFYKIFKRHIKSSVWILNIKTKQHVLFIIHQPKKTRAIVCVRDFPESLHSVYERLRSKIILTCTVILTCAVKQSEHVQTPRCLAIAIEEQIQLPDSPHLFLHKNNQAMYCNYVFWLHRWGNKKPNQTPSISDTVHGRNPPPPGF